MKPVREPVEVIDTVDLILPLTYTKTPDVILGASFTPHDTFRFEMNFKAHLRRFNPAWRFLLVPKEIDGKNHMCVEIYEGSKFLPLNDQMMKAIQPFAFLALNELPGYTLIVNSRESLTYQDITMPARWVQTILPFIQVLGDDSIVTTNGLYVNLESRYKIGHPQRPLEVSYNSLYATVLSKLRYLYVFGSIVLNDFQDQEIIRRWNLTPNRSLRSSDDEHLSIYHALWHNTLFAADKSRFLEKIPFDDVIISIPNPQRVKLQTEGIVQYTETEIIARVTTLQEANEIARAFLKS
ncbi:Hypothetical protein POVR1_LOCUS461 [uncultured virus]|nr:Hypothetical protein POVR1_LOCUS461 [uncultured virus]